MVALRAAISLCVGAVGCHGVVLSSGEGLLSNEDGLQVEPKLEDKLSLLEMGGIPGLQSNAFVDGKGQGMKAQNKPQPGMHLKVQAALANISSKECEARFAKVDLSQEGDCDRAALLAKLLIGASQGPEPPFTWEAMYRGMLGINFWLYVPGTMICYTILDQDDDGAITYSEMSRVFGDGLMNQFAATGLFKFMDGMQANGTIIEDGNITREDLHAYLRAVVVLRDYVPSLDAMDSEAPTQKCMMMSARVLHPPAKLRKTMAKLPKLACILGIMFGAFALHCMFCVKRAPEESKEQKKDVEEEDSPTKK